MTIWSGEHFDREYLNLACSNQTEGLREYRAASAQATDADVRAHAERNLETLENQQAIAGAIAKRLAS
jgi:predicted outer membrane protein